MKHGKFSVIGPASFMRQFLHISALVAALSVSHVVMAAATLPISKAKIDATVERAMKAFDIPGLALGIVKDGALIYAKGYGVREYGKPDRVDADTLFQIGSTTKAFTAAALAILVDEGKIHWDDRVIDYLPDFRMYDPYVTREFTIRDLLAHHSGLGGNAGDLMVFPQTDFTRTEIIHRLRYLEPVSSFRTQFAYNNLLYMVAGQIIPAVTGSSWEEFIKQRILTPLHMGSCAAAYELIEERTDVATPHIVVDGKIKPVAIMNLNAVGPAGSINCSINGMSKWLITQLAAGKGHDGRQLFSAERGAEMWSVNTAIPLSPALAALYGAHFLGYGLGWDILDELGRMRVAHDGGVPGTVAYVNLIPQLHLGVMVFTNQEDGGAMVAVSNQILDAYLGAPPRDWVDIETAVKKEQADAVRSAESQAAKIAASAGPPALPLDAYTGHYSDPWRGDATVRREGNQLVLKFSRTTDLEGHLTPFKGNVFIVRWRNEYVHMLQVDAYVSFTQAFDGSVSGMKMKAISAERGSGFDFEDLHFQKLEDR